MKKALSLGVAALFALFSHTAFAETATAAPNTPPTAVVQTQLNLLNINTATAAEIQDKLVGIGAKKAQAIVEYREKNGKFISVEQLTEVSGIGKATLDKNRDRIVLE